MKNVPFNKKKWHDVDYLYDFMQKHDLAQWDEDNGTFSLLGLIELCSGMAAKTAANRKTEILKLLKNQV